MKQVKVPLSQRLIDEALKNCLPFVEDDLLRFGRSYVEISIDPKTDFLRSRRLSPNKVEIEDAS
jgi:hypothetical protein